MSAVVPAGDFDAEKAAHAIVAAVGTPQQPEIEQLRERLEAELSAAYQAETLAPYLGAAAAAILSAAPPFLVASMVAALGALAVGVGAVVSSTIAPAMLEAARLVDERIVEGDLANAVRSIRNDMADDLQTDAEDAVRVALEQSQGENDTIRGIAVQSALNPEREPWIEHRDRVAATMATRAVNAAIARAVYLRGLGRGEAWSLRWVTERDRRVRPSHSRIDGDVVAAGETFGNGLRFPGDPMGEPDEVAVSATRGDPAGTY